jgi:DNA invertase Pin-like site-specific DNA recombinase
VTVLYTYRPTSQDERRLARWIEGQPGPVSLYRDTDPDRPELASVLAQVRSGLVRRLAVWRLADLGLSASGLAALLDEFATQGASLVFVTDPLDPMTQDGRRMALFLADALDTQRRLQGERQQDGERAHAMGVGRRGDWRRRRAGRGGAGYDRCILAGGPASAPPAPHRNRRTAR